MIFLALCALSVYPVRPSTAASLSTVAQTLMQIYEIHSEDYGQLVVQIFLSRITVVCQGAQWFSGRVLECERLRFRASPASHIHPSLVLVQPRTTCTCLTERFLMGCKESNQTNKQTIVCLKICVKWRIFLFVFILSHLPPSHHMECNTQSMLMTLQRMTFVMEFPQLSFLNI